MKETPFGMEASLIENGKLKIENGRNSLLNGGLIKLRVKMKVPFRDKMFLFKWKFIKLKVEN